jgi:hypothetical protein
VSFVLEQPGAIELRAFLDGQPEKLSSVHVDDFCVLGLFAMQGLQTGIVNMIPPGEYELSLSIRNKDGFATTRKVTATVVSGQTTVVEVNFDSQESATASAG